MENDKQEKNQKPDDESKDIVRTAANGGVGEVQDPERWE